MIRAEPRSDPEVAAVRGRSHETLRNHRLDGQVIAARDLTKDYGDKRAVDGLTFTVEPGVVTGFLGPNGAWRVSDMGL